MIVPTVEFILEVTLISDGIHRWPTKGGEIQIATAELRQALEAAYDPTMARALVQALRAQLARHGGG
jgi:hypothetical protein